MKYEEVPVQTFRRYALCACGGRMSHVEGSPMLLSDPPQFLNKCEKCGAEQHLRNEKSPTLFTREPP